MGIDVKYTRNPAAATIMQTAARRGARAAGVELLAASDALAPTEPDPKHGIHMTETGFVQLQPGTDTDVVVIGYKAFWAVLQNEDLTYHHPNGGQAKFLDTAVVAGGDLALATIASYVREALR